MTARTRVVVIGGGANCEHEVSLASAASVADHLDPRRHDVVRLRIDPSGRWLDAGGRAIGLTGAAAEIASADVVLPVVHGPHGEDGTLAALCDLAGVPCVGSGTRAGALAMDKWTTKLIANAVGVATAPGLLLTPATREMARWAGPRVVKPVAAGSSRGVSLVTEPHELGPALDAAFALDDRVLVEEVVHGREVDVAVLARPGGQRIVSPALEIVTDGLFDYDDKYGGEADFRLPARLSDRERTDLEAAAVRVFDALGCEGVARVDFFVTADGPVLGEVNTMPGLTSHSQVPLMLGAIGLGYADLLDLLIADAMRSGAAAARGAVVVA